MSKPFKTLLCIAGAATITLICSAQSSLTNGLVSYFPFNGNANDAVGTNSAGVVHGATLSTNRFGQLNSAYAFDGSSYIDLGQPVNLAFTNNYTITAWCLYKGGACCNPRILSYGQDPGYELISLGTGASRQFAYNGADNVLFGTSASFNEDVWYSVALVVSNLNATLYVNSIPLGNHAVAIATFPHNLQIGTKSEFGTDYWGGLIDDIRFYNRALPAIEIAQLYSVETTTLPPLGISTYNNTPVVFFPTLPVGLNYTLQMTTNLASPTWAPVTNAAPFTAYGITNAPANAFFRLN